jgi:large subunit ribosomal protein L25
MEIPVLKVQPREKPGKSGTRDLRNKGQVPATCYGRGLEPLSISLDPDDLLDIIRGPRGLNSLIKLDGAEDRTVFVQEMQKDPVERHLLHVDFIFVDTQKAIQRDVPVELVGKPEGVKLGGVLQVTQREILIEALPAELPDKVSVNVEELLVGQSIHVEEVDFPAGVKAIYDRNYNICAVVAPTEEKEPEKEELTEEEAAAAAAAALEAGEVPPEGAEGEKPAEGAEAAAPGEKTDEKAPAEEEKPKKFKKGKGKEEKGKKGRK